MKGFPNQISDLKKLALAMRVIGDLLKVNKNPYDDGIFGEALVRQKVISAGRTPMPIEEYIAKQKEKRIQDQSFRATARGLREFFRILKLVDDRDEKVKVTLLGKQIIETSGKELSQEIIELWRRVVRSIYHESEDREASHPYQVLLRLVAKCPGITRAKCALALEAKNDSEKELDRIVKLAKLPEEDIVKKLGVKKSNWNNAKKILPSIAEQLGDVQKVGHKLFLSDAPGVSDQTPIEESKRRVIVKHRGPRRPRSSSSVTAKTIAGAGAVEESDEFDDELEKEIDPKKLQARRKKILNRLRRHNGIVREIAGIFESKGAKLFEHPFDCLACFDVVGLLVEVKSLDGSEPDEVSRVREALGQLLYYEAFVTDPYAEGKTVLKVACFEGKIMDKHIAWLKSNDVNVIWKEPGGFKGDEESMQQLSPYIDF
ncbi:MAG: hypothetical protein E3J72_14270 [Planctomycetota bacterium]|nr:MAG: hypothetical protein E3J72_14270 [Planctomycetota bacterium]